MTIKGHCKSSRKWNLITRCSLAWYIGYPLFEWEGSLASLQRETISAFLVPPTRWINHVIYPFSGGKFVESKRLFYLLNVYFKKMQSLQLVMWFMNTHWKQSTWDSRIQRLNLYRGVTPPQRVAQLAGAVEYADCISVEV